MKADVLLGLQWGDEGKGKVVDFLSPKYQIIARFQGGPNAGHTLEFEGKKHVLHTIPSGIFHPEQVNVVGNGVVIDPVIFSKELDGLKPHGVVLKDRLLISKKAHLILPSHRLLDAASEAAKGSNKIGSTLKGIGPTYMDKTGRNGLRVGDIIRPDFRERYDKLVEKHKQILAQYPDFEYEINDEEWFQGIERLRSLQLIDSEQYLNDAMDAGKRVLAEGAQGTLLDIDFGTYPFVTSSNTVASGACSGLGIAPNRIGDVIGIFKAYCTRVGSGPFPTELENEEGERLRKEGAEFGATTGRPRRCGWIDLVALRYAVMVNGVTKACMMKADVLDQFDEIKVCDYYLIDGEKERNLPFSLDVEIEPVYESHPGWNTVLRDLKDLESGPQQLRDYTKMLEKALNTPIAMVSVGPDRAETILTSSWN